MKSNGFSQWSFNVWLKQGRGQHYLKRVTCFVLQHKLHSSISNVNFEDFFMQAANTLLNKYWLQ